MLELRWSPRAQREGAKLPRDVRDRLTRALERYVEERHGDVRLVRGTQPEEWRLRVGDYRIRFRVRGDVLEVLHVGHRREVYRR